MQFHTLNKFVTDYIFRYDYFDRNVTPFLKDLKMKSTYADYMRNVFVTKTFPNHHTISTGLFVETHGVVDSEYYDTKLNKTFKYSNELFHYNNDILPIWVSTIYLQMEKFTSCIDFKICFYVLNFVNSDTQ